MSAKSRFVPPETEQQALVLIRVAFDGLAPLASRLDALSGVAGGSFYQLLEQATPYEHFSSQLRAAVGIAEDHLESLKRLLVHESGQILLPTYAAYSLIRPALEAIARGLWLVDGGKLNKLVMKSLKLTWDDVQKNSRLTELIDPNSPNAQLRVHQRLEQIRNRRPALKQLSFESLPSTTDMLIEINRNHKKIAALDIRQAWTMCSALTHGNSMSTISLLEHEHIEGETYRLTSSASLVALALDSALRYMELLGSEWERLLARR